MVNSDQHPFLWRLLLCMIFQALLLFYIDAPNYDLHFFARGPQTASSEILVLSMSSNRTSLPKTLRKLQQLEPKAIVLFERHRGVAKTKRILTYRKLPLSEEDGKVRLFKAPSSFEKTFALLPSAGSRKRLINYRGPENTFQRVFDFEVQNQKILPAFVKGKIILVETINQKKIRTPVGPLSLSEFYANVFDNLLHERWIQKVPLYAALLFSSLFILLVALIVTLLPTSLSLTGVFFSALTLSSVCFLLFDKTYWDLPIYPLLIQILITYLVFIIYKLGQKEKVAWRLEKEQAYNNEMTELKKNFLNLFSHDLKTPIAKILAQIDIINKKQKSQEPISENLLKIKKYSHDLNSYVKNILKISQIEADRFSIKKEPADINEIIQMAFAELRLLAQEKEIQVDLDLEPLFSLNCDKELVKQIILNLIENAIKYSPNGTKVRVSSEELDEFVVIRVSDQGPGIKPSDRDLIWQKFSRLNDRTEGSGLGLYLVKFFVEAHNGAVFVDDNPNEKGSIIGFKLPVS